MTAKATLSAALCASPSSRSGPLADSTGNGKRRWSVDASRLSRLRVRVVTFCCWVWLLSGAKPRFAVAACCYAVHSKPLTAVVG